MTAIQTALASLSAHARLCISMGSAVHVSEFIVQAADIMERRPESRGVAKILVGKAQSLVAPRGWRTRAQAKVWGPALAQLVAELGAVPVVAEVTIYA